MYHDGAHSSPRFQIGQIDQKWTRRATRARQTPNTSIGFTHHTSDFTSQFPTPLPRSAIVGYDDNVRKEITYTPKSTQSEKSTTNIKNVKLFKNV